MANKRTIQRIASVQVILLLSCIDIATGQHSQIVDFHLHLKCAGHNLPLVVVVGLRLGLRLRLGWG